MFTKWLLSITKKAQDLFDTGIEELANAKWALSTDDLRAVCLHLTQSCIAVLNSSNHSGAEMDSAVEKLKNFTELKTLKYTEVNAKRWAEQEIEANKILQDVIAKMKEEVDAEVSDRER